MVAVIIGVFAGQILGDVAAIKFDSETSPYLGEIFDYYVSNPQKYFELNQANLIMGLLCAGLGSVGFLSRIFKLRKLAKKFEQTGKID